METLFLLGNASRPVCTPSQQNPSVIISDNHLEAGAIQGVNIVNSIVNNPVIKIKGESMNDQVKTDIRDMATEQRRQGETVKELAVDLVNEQQIQGETLNTLQTEQRDIAAEQKIQGETMEAGFSTNQIELGYIAGELKRREEYF